MDCEADSDDLEERWHRMFSEFQDFRSQRKERKVAAREELDAGQKQIDAEILKIQNEQAERIEAIEGGADAKLRQIKEQTDKEIKRLQDEARRKTTEIQKETTQDIEKLKANAGKKTQELEDKRILRKRKHDHDDKEIDFEFSSRLKALDGHFRPSALPETPPPSATREVPIDPQPINGPSTEPSLLADLRPRDELPESRRPALNSLPPLRSCEHDLPPPTTRVSDPSTRAGKKRRFEGFAKDGCVTCKGRIWWCDGARPICGKCKADGQLCLWPHSTASQQPAPNDTSTNNTRREIEDTRTTGLRPSNVDSTVRAGLDLSPAFAYDARRRPSQRLVEPLRQNQERGPGLGDSFVEQLPISRPPQVPTPRAPSLPTMPQPERSGQRSSSLITQKTITYDEVFKNVQSQDSREKHFIVGFPDGSNKWYILRCDKHDMNFGDYPFYSARNHLASEAHGHIPRTSENSISELGVLVLGCNTKLANKNNRAYQKALQGGYKPKQGNIPPRPHKRRRSRAGGASKHDSTRPRLDLRRSRRAGLSRPFEGIVDPNPGEVYQGALREPGSSRIHWSLVVRLPVDNWNSIGINGSLKDSPLAKSIPPCYQRTFLGDSESLALDWDLGFQIRGPRVKERIFPCLILSPFLEIPPWGQDFTLSSGERFLCWVDAASFRPCWFKHPRTKYTSSNKDIADCQKVAHRYRQRLEAARASRRGSRQKRNNQNDHNTGARTEVDIDNEDTSEIHDQPTAVADEPGDTQGNMSNNGTQQPNGSDVEALQEDDDDVVTEDSIVVISSECDEDESSLSPVPSTVDSDPFDSSYSPRSTASDGRNVSLDPSVLDEDFDIDDYNDPPRSPSTITQIVAGSESGGCALETVDGNSFAGPGGSTSAVEGLRAIQAELIPGYEDRDDRSEASTRATERSDLHLLFPGLPTSHTREVHTTS